MAPFVTREKRDEIMKMMMLLGFDLIRDGSDGGSDGGYDGAGQWSVVSGSGGGGGAVIVVFE
jgi:hypothetical protein